MLIFEFQTSAMYQMQRKLRTLKEQLQRKDLHLDLLKRKLAIQVGTFFFFLAFEIKLFQTEGYLCLLFLADTINPFL